MQDLRKVGIQVNFKPIIFNDLVTSLRDSHRWDMILLGWGSGVPPDPANGKNITLSSGRLHAWNPQQPKPATPWESRIDSLMAMMDEELDDTVRKKLLRRGAGTDWPEHPDPVSDRRQLVLHVENGSGRKFVGRACCAHN